MQLQLCERLGFWINYQQADIRIIFYDGNHEYLIIGAKKNVYKQKGIFLSLIPFPQSPLIPYCLIENSANLLGISKDFERIGYGKIGHYFGIISLS